MEELQRFLFYRVDTTTSENFTTLNAGRMFGWGNAKEANEYAALISNDEWIYFVQIAEDQSENSSDLNLSDAIYNHTEVERLSSVEQGVMNGQEALVLNQILETNRLNSPVNYKSGLHELENNTPDWMAEQSFWELLKPLIENGAVLEQDIQQEQELIKVVGEITHDVMDDDNYQKVYPMHALSKEAKLENISRKVRKLIDRYRGYYPLALFNNIKLKGVIPKAVILTNRLQDGKILEKATRLPVYVAVGKLKKPLELLREKLPEAEITICSENMHNLDTNYALQNALNGAQLIKAAVSIPRFCGHELKNGLQSFSDLYESRGQFGLQAVKESFENYIVNYADKYRQPKTRDQILAQAKKAYGLEISR